MSPFAAYICKLRDHINQNHLYYLKSILSSGALDGTPQTAEQYLHGGQKGEAWVVPGLSGPATVEDLGGRVSLDLWAGPKKKNVPSQGEPHHVGWSHLEQLGPCRRAQRGEATGQSWVTMPLASE